MTAATTQKPRTERSAEPSQASSRRRAQPAGSPDLSAEPSQASSGRWAQPGGSSLPITGVYLLTPDVAAQDFTTFVPRFTAAVAAGVALVQYRNKQAPPAQRRAQATALQSIARRHGALFIINDDVELAAGLGAGGVHLGRDDGDLAAARARLPHALLGASCYADLARAQRAADAGADLLAFGSVFASATKPQAVRAPLELLREARERFANRCIVAIGGITAANIASVSAAGAHAAAVISAVFDAPDPGRAVQELQKAFHEGLIEHDQRTAV